MSEITHDDMIAELEPDAVDPQAARRFGAGLFIASMLLLVVFLYFNVVLPRQLFTGADISIGEAEQLQNTVGIIDKMMKIEERLGHTVTREATPNPPPKEPFGQNVTLTVSTQAGETTVYKFRYALEAIPSVEQGDRLVRLYPLNQAGARLLTDLELPFEAPVTPLPD